ncbi:30S ribosomal protein S4 [Candidatus Woesearchaeota archaeon]|nr:30S ribosomal protein S4 [Candidatus Woesearchaeota archaeon]
MGDPRKIRAKYSGPAHPWNADRIAEEKQLIYDYGLKNKKEIWRLQSRLRDYSQQAKELIAATGRQAELEQAQLFGKLQRLGLVSQAAKLDDVLGLSLKNLLERRLQTQLVRKNMARTMKQSRQFISHGHIIVDGKIITSPSYLVTVQEEPSISFITASSLASSAHPERQPIEKKRKPRKAPEKRGRRRRQ